MELKRHAMFFALAINTLYVFEMRYSCADITFSADRNKIYFSGFEVSCQINIFKDRSNKDTVKRKVEG